MSLRDRSARGLAPALAVMILAGCSDNSAPNVRAIAACDWTMAGHDLSHTAATTCREAVNATTVSRLKPVWFHETKAEVTGAPVVDATTVYFGDWDGVLHGVDRATGDERWNAQLPTTTHVYAGQIPSSPALTTVAGTPAVITASGSSVVASSRSDGTVIWSKNLARDGDPNDPTEIEGAPMVVGDQVLVPSDVHNTAGYSAGLVSLALADGAQRWRFDPETGAPPGGCGDIWGSPSVDTERSLVVVGTANCNENASWTKASEAIVGVDLRTGALRWAFQPHQRGNHADWDFAGAANLYQIGDRPVAGLGNKDGWYYVVDRTTGNLVWKAQAQKQSADGRGFSFGGFIGALTLIDGVLVGGTAVGDCPCQVGFDASTGKVLWQDDAPTGTYAGAGGVDSPSGGLAFQTGVDQTLRAYSPRTGRVVWKATLPSISSSGPTLAGDQLFIGTGFRQPGSPSTGGGGVQAFRVLAKGERPPTSPPTTAPQGAPVTALAPSPQECVGGPCSLPFQLKKPPAGITPTLSLQIDPDPFTFTLTATGLGDPSGWLSANGEARKVGATTYMAFITPSDAKPELGSILCTFGPDGSCTANSIAHGADAYTRISVLAVADAATPPTLAEGYDRLVTTHSFDPALTPSG